MSRYLPCSIFVVLAIACGGSTDEGGPSGGGSSAGGAGSGGTSNGGSAGMVTAGSTGRGGSIGTSGAGGSIVIAGSGGSGGTVDPRCPALEPAGECSGAGLYCEYDPFSHCLCHSRTGPYGFCEKVDPYCPGSAPEAGTPPAPPPPEGIGGISTKIALPPHRVCSCASGNWTCTSGY